MSMSDSPRPLRADAARNRDRILTAAREVFAARGLDVTLDDVARHAGLGTGTVYRRFPDRAALIEAHFTARIAETVALGRQCLADPDPWRALVRLLESTREGLVVDKGLRQVMFSSSYGHEGLACARQEILPIVEQLVERGKAAGVVRCDVEGTDVPVLLLMIGTVAEFAGSVAPDLWRRYFAFVLDGLRPADQQDPVGAGLCRERLTEAMSCYQPARPAAVASAVPPS